MERETYHFQVPNHPTSAPLRLFQRSRYRRMATLPLVGAIVYVALVVGLTLYIDAPVAFAIGFALPGAALAYRIVQDAAVKRKRTGSTVIFFCFLVLAAAGMAYLYNGIR